MDSTIPVPPPTLCGALPLSPAVIFLPACAENVLIVGDIQYALVADVAAEIQLTVRAQVKEYAISEVKGRLNAIVERENAQVVVALGMDAVAEAMRLPPEIAVVYGLVVVPPRNGRVNVTGVYMSPPVSEYVSTVRRYLPAIDKVSVVGSQSMMKSLLVVGSTQVSAYNVGSSADLVNTVNRLVDTKALLLLPDANLLTAQVMSNVYLFSFRKISHCSVSRKRMSSRARCLRSYSIPSRSAARSVKRYNPF